MSKVRFIESEKPPAAAIRKGIPREELPRHLGSYMHKMALSDEPLRKTVSKFIQSVEGQISSKSEGRDYNLQLI